MALPWESRLIKLQRTIEAFWNCGDIDFKYGVVHIKEPQAVTECGVTREIFEPPHIYASGLSHGESLMVPLGHDEYQLHLVFSTDFSDVDRNALKRFKTQLRDFRDLFPIIPQRVLPAPRVPAIAEGADEDFVRWGLSLIWLGATEQNVFHNVVEHAATAREARIKGNVARWEEFSPVPEFNPIAMVTLTESLNRGWEYWNQQHSKSGRSFPQVFAVSLTKPILYASLNAIDLLIQRGKEQRPVPKKVKLKSRELRDGTTLSKRELLVLNVLRSHHCRSDADCFEPLTQDEIGLMAGLSQSTAQRALEDLLDRIAYGKGMRVSERYEKLCEGKLIIGILDQIENPKSEAEYTTSEFDHFESDNRR